MSLHKCFIGNVSVQSYALGNIFTNTYCGLMSTMINYPPRRWGRIVISSEYKVEYEVLFSYCVIDTNIIYSCPSRNAQYFKQCWFVPQFKTEIQMFHIETEKYQLIKVSAPKNFNLEMLNGPGILSRVLVPVNLTDKTKMYLTSTFQCVILLWTKFSSHKLLSYEFLSEYSLSETVIDQTKNPLEQITFPNTTYATQPVLSILKFRTHQNYFINVSVLEFSYNNMLNPKETGPFKLINVVGQNAKFFETDFCDVAGLVAYNVVNNSYEKISSVCSFAFKHQNIYSSISKLLLAMYMYPEYEIVRIKLTVSITHCSHITINTCTFELPCHFTDGSQCNYLKQLANFESNCVGESFECNHLDNPYSKITMDLNQCIVLQLNHNTDHYTKFPTARQILMKEIRPDVCRIKNLELKPAFKEGVVLYNVTGFVLGKKFFLHFYSYLNLILYFIISPFI